MLPVPVAGNDARMTWARPVPVVGDRTSATERAANPRSWRFGEENAGPSTTYIGARRDIRRFRPDTLEPGLVERRTGRRPCRAVRRSLPALAVPAGHQRRDPRARLCHRRT